MKIRRAYIENSENNLLNLYQELEEYHYNNRPEIFKKSNIKELKQELVDKINDIIVIEEEGRIQAFAIYTTKDRMSQKVLFIEIQYIESKNDLKEEYERLKWIEGKLNTPKAYYYNEKDNIKYLIMEYKKGSPSFEFDNIGYQLGKALKQIHQVNIEDCPFDKYSPKQLLSNFLIKFESIYPEIQDNYKDETKESIIKFMKENIPNDTVLTHGDYSMPNILINNDEISFIDLGEVGMSTKYLDIYYFMKSLKINEKEEIFQDFLNGYGLEKINNNYIKWMDLINTSLC